MLEQTIPNNKATPSTEYSIYPTRCGILSPVAQSSTTGLWNGGEIFCQFSATSAGSVIIEAKDGSPIYFPSVLAGELRIAVGRRILSSATINGNSVNTTVTSVVVYGGK